MGCDNHMLNQLFWYIYRIPVPAVLPIIAVVVLIWGVAMRFLAGRLPYAVKYGNLALAVVALGGILYITVLRNNPGKQELILQPFQSFTEAKQQKEMYREMLMNVLLFVPFGLCVPFGLNPVREDRAFRYVVFTVLLALALSAGIEIIQYYFSLGRCETDDVIFNCTGTILGSIAYIIFLINRKGDNYVKR